MLEDLLLKVGNFTEQLLYQIDDESAEDLIEKYYGLDASFCREMAGKKLSSRTRKDLDDISEKTGIALKSCRRQFDNIKRVARTVEELPGAYVPNIVRLFHVSKELAEEYATLVFLSAFKFEMSKRKLSRLPFSTIKTVSLIVMENWLDYSDVEEPALDKELLASFKELKVLADRDKEHRNIVCSRLQHHADRVSARSSSEIESNFKTLTRSIISLGVALSSSKEVKDFFVHLVEKISEPLRGLRLESSELELFLQLYVEALTDHVLLVDESVRKALQKFMITLAPCIVAVYEAGK